MAWASWTTTGVIAGLGGVATQEVGTITGDLTVHTTWYDGQADVAVQYTGALDWFTMGGSPVPAQSEAHSRAVHQAAVEAIRAGGVAAVPNVGPPVQRSRRAALVRDTVR
ncbi:hypothetical protein ACFV3R_27000 [Streptomyces sp. NPDC059740]|uniref:hypothetical protein n=1 Tax=Streptomyces sp. NPDC059740 TaxID=3346926 RepID=UPI0036696440